MLSPGGGGVTELGRLGEHSGVLGPSRMLVWLLSPRLHIRGIHGVVFTERVTLQQERMCLYPSLPHPEKDAGRRAASETTVTPSGRRLRQDTGTVL